MITIETIRTLSYPDFVGFINQWNVLPGAYNTVSQWAVYSRMNAESSLLQIGCTTGFQSRELSKLTGCTAVGVDLSVHAIQSAKYNLEYYSPECKVAYHVGDMETYQLDRNFTHIAIGAGLRFFRNPEKVLTQCINLFNHEGFILASPFYAHTTVPPELVERSKQVFGIIPTVETYKESMKPYTRFEILFEEKKTIIPETDEEITQYCEDSIARFAREKNITNAQMLNYAYRRLKLIRLTTNELRHYQGYSVLVLRYRQRIYPNRYVELF